MIASVEGHPTCARNYIPEGCVSHAGLALWEKSHFNEAVLASCSILALLLTEEACV